MQGKGGDGPGGGGGGGPKGGGNPQAKADRDKKGLDEADGAAPFSQEGAINGLDGAPGLGAVGGGGVNPGFSVPEQGLAPGSVVTPEVVPDSSANPNIDIHDTQADRPAATARPPSRPEPGLERPKPAVEERTPAQVSPSTSGNTNSKPNTSGTTTTKPATSFFKAMTDSIGGLLNVDLRSPFTPKKP